MTGGTVKAGSTGTVVDVLTAVLTRPAIDTHTVVAAVGVVAGPTILAGVGHELTLIHVLCAVLTCLCRGPLALMPPVVFSPPHPLRAGSTPYSQHSPSFPAWYQRGMVCPCLSPSPGSPDGRACIHLV